MAQEVDGVVVAGETLPLRTDGGQNASPMQYVRGSCTPEELAVLKRWHEGQQLAGGNRSVIFFSGIPRGRYAPFALRGIPLETYIAFEVAAYRWILQKHFRGGTMDQAEFFARMEAGETTHDFLEWGALVSNSDDRLIAYGAAVGSTRALAWILAGAYEVFTEMHKQRQAALRAGRSVSAADACASRALAVANAVNGHKLAKTGNSR